MRARTCPNLTCLSRHAQKGKKASEPVRARKQRNVTAVFSAAVQARTPHHQYLFKYIARVNPRQQPTHTHTHTHLFGTETGAKMGYSSGLGTERKKVMTVPVFGCLRLLLLSKNNTTNTHKKHGRKTTATAPETGTGTAQGAIFVWYRFPPLHRNAPVPVYTQNVYPTRTSTCGGGSLTRCCTK